MSSSPTHDDENGLGSMPTIFLYIYSAQLVLSFTLNAMVLHLTIRRFGSMKRLNVREDYLQNYRLLLSHTAVVCMRSSFIFWLSQMVIHIRPKAAIITTKGPLLLLFNHSKIGFIIFKLLFSDFPGIISVMALSVSLEVLYRYLAVIHPKTVLRFFGPKRTLLLLVPVYLLEIGIFILGYTGVTNDQTALSNYFPIGNGHVDAESIYIGTFFANSPGYIIACSLSCIIALASVVFVFYCSAKVREQLRRRETVLYSRTINAQRKLVFALRIQAVIPILFVIPQFVVTLLTMTTSTTPLQEYFAFNLIGWFPVLDPLITIYFVKPFRLSLYRVFGLNYTKRCKSSLLNSSPKTKAGNTMDIWLLFNVIAIIVSICVYANGDGDGVDDILNGKLLAAEMTEMRSSYVLSLKSVSQI
uniref:G protein-coupled receptor n=1 Tax=Syphacia muris TaxID=451379 RepID=A0A0N5ATU7_9BILA